MDEGISGQNTLFFGHPQYLDILIPERYNEDWIIKTSSARSSAG
jgi:hypothetical protein